MIVPAAGIGKRMQTQTQCPKQYLEIHKRPIIEYTIESLLQCTFVEKIIVVISKNDHYWQKIKTSNANKILVTIGGEERFHSVLNGLDALIDFAADSDWVLVHDAVRPCLQKRDVEKLIQSVNDHPVGGLLALRVRDTIKRNNTSNHVIETINREQLWLAQTPQMFRFGLLKQAIAEAIQKNIFITDEASAIEAKGMQPLLVEGNPENIKITQPEDLVLAEKYLDSTHLFID